MAAILSRSQCINPLATWAVLFQLSLLSWCLILLVIRPKYWLLITCLPAALALSSTWPSTVIASITKVNTLRPRQNGRHFPDDIFKCIFFNENLWISLKISLQFVPKVRNNNVPALVQIMAWRRPDNKPLSEPMMAYLLTHICVTRPQWVKQ